MLRTRQYRTGTEVLVGLVSGILGLRLGRGLDARGCTPTGDPRSRSCSPATGAVLLAVTLLPVDAVGAPRSARRRRRERRAARAAAAARGRGRPLLRDPRLSGAMATKKDLVEAYSFSRRRLVTAFVSGAPGGREVEPARPGRTIVGGLALAVLLVAGAAIAGVFAPTHARRLERSTGLIVSKDTGAAYVIVEESERPGAAAGHQLTCATLILGAGRRADADLPGHHRRPAHRRRHRHPRRARERARRPSC